MTQYKCIIIDDEKQARNALRHEIQTHCPELLVVAEADSVQGGIKCLEAHTADILFLDVRLGDGTGFDILGELATSAKVVFTTAYSEYALRAFKFSAVDYLLKPIDGTDLKACVEKIIGDDHSKVTERLMNMLRNHTLSPTERRVAIPSATGVHLFNVSDIVRLNAQRNYTDIYFEHRGPLLSAKNLKEFEEMLMQHGFLRVHNSHLVNSNKISSYQNKDGGYLIMTDNSVVPIAQRKKTEILHFIQSRFG